MYLAQKRIKWRKNELYLRTQAFYYTRSRNSAAILKASELPGIHTDGYLSKCPPKTGQHKYLKQKFLRDREEFKHINYERIIG